MTKEKVGLITINYKNTLFTKNLIESLSKLKEFNSLRIIVIDNSSTTDSKEELEVLRKKYESNIDCFYLPDNLYYFKGAEYALRKVYPSVELMPEWIIICNNDIIIEQEDFIEKLIMLDYRKYGIIAPSIISMESGKDQNPFLVYPYDKKDIIKRKILLSNFYVYYLIINLLNLKKKIKTKLFVSDKYSLREGKELRIYAPHGSFIIFSRLYFEKGGYIDTNFDLYGEELTIAEIARRINVPVVYLPFLKVIHMEHKSLGNIISKKKFYMARKAFEYVCREYLNKGDL